MKVNYKIGETIFAELHTLAEIKNYLRVTHDYDDQLIFNLYQTAIIAAENLLGVSINVKIITALVDKAAKFIKLRHTKIIEIKSVNILDDKGKLDITNSYGSFDSNVNQLQINEKYINRNLEIEYVSSFYNNEILPPIKQGILMHIALMYEYSDHNAQITAQIKDLYLPYRILKI